MSVTDGHGGADWKNFTLSVLNVNDVPVITTEVDTDVFDGMTYLVDFDAFDVDPTIDILTWNVTTNGSWLIFNETTGVLNGTPMNVDIGWYYVDINVDDGNGGRDWLNYTLTVMNMNDEPIITTTDNVTAIEDMRYNIDYDAIDADPTNDTLEWSLYTDAAWLEINASTGILNGTPTNADVGSYRVMIKVVDGQGEFATREFLLNVKNINDAPVILTMDKMDATEDKFYSRYYNADDIDITGDTLNWSLTTNAFWLALADNHLHGMPGNEEVGSFWVNVTVADGQGGSDWTNFTLSVYPDFDGDGLNDTVDPDDDNDGVNDTQDDFPFDANESTDNDGDGIGDNGDDDDDNDGWNDTFENLVGTDALNNNSIPTDTDGDLTPDTLDGDDDNDGWSDQEEDIYGTDALDNSSAPLDTDNDGTPDAWDQDDDGDDWADSIEVLVGTDPLDGSSVPSDEDGDGVADLVDADFKKGLAGEAEAETPAWAYIVLILMIIGWLVALLMISKKPTEAVEAEEKKGDIEHEIWEPGEEEEGEYEEEEEEIEVAENLEEESVPEEGLETSGVTTEEVKEEEEVEKGPEENEAAIKDVQKRMKKVKHYYKNKKISKKKYVHLMKKYKRMLKEDQAERGIKPEEGTLEEEPEVKEEVEVEPEELAVVEKAEDRGEAAEGEEKETVEAEEEEEVEEADEIEEEAVKEDAEEVDEKEGVEEANEEIAILKVIIEEEDEEEEGIYTEEIR